MELNRRNYARLEALVKKLLSEEEAIKTEYTNTVETLTQKESEAQFNQQSLLEAMDKLAEIKSNLSRLETEKAALEKDIESYKLNLDLMREEMNVEQKNLDATQIRLKENAEEYLKFKEELKDNISRDNDILSEVSSYTDKSEKLSEKLIASKSRQKILNEMRTAFEGYTFSVKNLLKDSKTDR